MSEAGRLFGGRYEVQGPLASGGMAEVFVARDRLLGRPVALKILHPEFARDRAFIERFRREAQSAASLNDPRVVSIYDWGSDGGTYYLVMEFVEGKSLKELIQSEGPFTAERAEEIAADVCSALHFAHRHGIVHRDVKPANIMINAEGKTKVMDFGIARAIIADSGATVTQTGTVLGTANYLSPEQAQGMPVDARSDVYSVGVVLYEMLTGEVPFKADTAVAIAYKHVRESPKPPSQLNAEIPPALDSVVLKALSKNADNRYQSADEMRLDLQRLLAGQAVEATPVLPADQTVAMGTALRRPPREATTVLPAVGGPRPPPSRRGLAYALVLILIVAILAGAGALIYGVVSGGTASVVVPSVVGSPVDQAIARLAQSRLKGVKDAFDFSDTVAKDSVISQNPADGRKAQPNSNVLLTVSNGPQTSGVPDVSGKSVDQAKSLLQSAGFTPGTLSQEFSSTVPQGQVTRTDPPSGTVIAKSKPVNLYVSGGKQTTPLTDVTGFDQAHATQVLHDEGFNPVPTAACDRTQQPGAVLQQNPAGNQQAPLNSDVTITVNQAKAVPNLINMTQGDATVAIQRAGFIPQVQAQTSLFGPPAGTVVDQSPKSTQNACPGDTVSITVSQGIGQPSASSSSSPSPSPSPSASP